MVENRWLGIAQELAEEIRAGELHPGVRLPTQGELAETYDVSRATIGKAVRYLRALGLVEGAERDRPVVTRALLPTRGAAGRYERGKSPAELFAGSREHCRTLDAGRAEPPQRVADLLGVEPGTTCTWRERLLTDAGTPVSHHRAWWALDHDRLADPARMDEGTTNLVEDVTGRAYTTAVDRVSARGATPAEADHLELRPGEPVLEVVHVAYDEDGEPLEVVEGVDRPGRTREGEAYEL